MAFKKQELKVLSSNGVHKLAGGVFVPTTQKPVGFFQVVHGMTEYIDRYDHLLSFLAENGYAAFGYDLLTSFSASIACISNVGPGFGAIGSLENYSELPVMLKLCSTLLMLIGRLEIFGFIQLLFIRSWR